ncbi:MAG: hypothetical protein KC589_09295 [Nanoarchaeota archaeon]|nr:hypothetical protein [Nanoarchaeota archaeon]
MRNPVVSFSDYKNAQNDKNNQRNEIKNQILRFENGVYIGIESLLYKIQDLTRGKNPKIFKLEREVGHIKNICGFSDDSNISYEIILRNQSHLFKENLLDVFSSLEDISSISSDIIISLFKNQSLNKKIKKDKLKERYDEFSQLRRNILHTNNYANMVLAFRDMNEILKSYSNFFEIIQKAYD